MNVTGGLVRLWLVASGLWLVFVAFILYDGFFSPYVPGKAYYFQKDISLARQRAETDKGTSPWSKYSVNTPDGFIYSMTGSTGEDAANRVLSGIIETDDFMKEPIAVEKYTEAYRLLEEGITRGATEQIDVSVPDTFLFIRKTAPEDVKNRQAKQVYELASEDRNAVVGKKRSDAVKSFAGLGLIPPATAFALGWLVLWVVRGFRAR